MGRLVCSRKCSFDIRPGQGARATWPHRGCARATPRDVRCPAARRLPPTGQSQARAPTPMTQPFSPDDLNLHRKVMAITCTPGVPIAAATVRSVDLQNDGYASAIWSVPLDGGEPRQMTRGPWLDQGPQWDPQGRTLAFLSPRTGSVQVHLLPADGGEARACSHFEGGATAL